MIRGLYTAATGMNAQAKKMDVISNDLANVDTTGYKKDTVVLSAFNEVDSVICVCLFFTEAVTL